MMAEFSNQEHKYPIYRGPHFMCCYCKTMFISEEFLDKHQKKCFPMKFHLMLKIKLQLRTNKLNEVLTPHFNMGDSSSKQISTKSQLFFNDDAIINDEPMDDRDADTTYLPVQSSNVENNEYIQPALVEMRGRSPHPTPEKPLPSRERKINLSKRERNKKSKNEGRPYKNSKGLLVAGHTIGELCTCPFKCQNILLPVKNELFDNFWNLADFDKQNAYLFDLIESYDVKRRYGEMPPELSRRQKSYYFKVKIGGNLHRVCRKSFLAVHGLQNNRGRLNNILKQVKSSSTPKKDQRGQHDNRPNRISEEKITAVHDHIKLIREYQTDYSRTQNPNKVFFNCDLNITSFYRDYFLDFCKEKNVEAVSEDKYRRIFNAEFNKGFKLQKSDT